MSHKLKNCLKKSLILQTEGGQQDYSLPTSFKIPSKQINELKSFKTCLGYVIIEGAEVSSKIRMSLGTGVILGYRFGNREQNPNQVFVKVLSTILRSPHNLVGAKVSVRDNHGNTYYGRVIKVHGNGKNKVVIVRFNNNLPGQVIGSRVDIFKLRSS